MSKLFKGLGAKVAQITEYIMVSQFVAGQVLYRSERHDVVAERIDTRNAGHHLHGWDVVMLQYMVICTP